MNLKKSLKEVIKVGDDLDKIKKSINRNTDSLIIIAVVLILFFVSWITIFDWPFKYEQSQKASFVGIAAFVIPIILALSRRFNLAARFGSGEIRKAIVITLTVVYIIMLSSYFYNVTLPAGEKLSNSSPNNYTELVNLTKASSNVQNTSPVITTIPAAALKDITTNFFWVYAVIIVFYFGSRAWESRAEADMIKEVRDFDPFLLAQKRYVLGMLSPENYEEICKKLGGALVLLDVDEKNNKIILKVMNLGKVNRPVDKYWINGKENKLVPEVVVKADGYQMDIETKEAPPQETAKYRITYDGNEKTFPKSN